MNKISWVLKKFDDLTTTELYCILKLRSEVFVVEQNCVYLDTDGKDAFSYHFCGWQNNLLVAYCRILPPGLAFPQASIGRVVTHPSHRLNGYGKILMQKAINHTYNIYQCASLQISAQQYLHSFYRNLGFHDMGDHYLEDGIPHLHMIHQR